MHFTGIHFYWVLALGAMSKMYSFYRQHPSIRRCLGFNVEPWIVWRPLVYIRPPHYITYVEGWPCEEMSLRPPHYITYVDYLFLWRSFYAPAALYYLCWSSVLVRKCPGACRFILHMLISYLFEKKESCSLRIVSFVEQPSFVNCFMERHT